MRKILTYKQISASLAVISMVALIMPSGAFAATNNAQIIGNGDPSVIVCNVLASIGMGCGNSTYTSNNTNNTSNTSGGVVAGASTTNLTANIVKAYSDNEINLVRVPRHQEIYELYKGQKHLIPNMDIFSDYGFQIEQIQDISQKDLDKYSRVKLMRVKGSSQVYYFTEGGMIRPVPNQEVFDSYGDREEDIIDISKKEFNFYPVNQFVFQEMPLNRDVFQIVNGTKRYLTPMAVIRMKLDDSQMAPINQTELNYYKTGTPIIY